MRLVQLPAKLLNEALKITQPLHDLAHHTLIRVLLCVRLRW